MTQTRLVYPAIVQAVNKERAYVSSGPRRLWGSDLGYCPRKAMLRVLGYPATIEFSTDAKLKMRAGVVWEDETIAALLDLYGDQRLITQFVLSTPVWSCKVDAVLDHHTDRPVLIEHKAVGDKWWNYKSSLPKPEHIAQLWLYGELYRELYDIPPRLILFYRSWGHYAEFALGSADSPTGLRVEGEIDGIAYTRTLDLPLAERRASLERSYASGQLPDRLANREDGCTFRGAPSCAMYYHCHASDSQW